MHFLTIFTKIIFSVTLQQEEDEETESAFRPDQTS